MHEGSTSRRSSPSAHKRAVLAHVATRHQTAYLSKFARTSFTDSVEIGLASPLQLRPVSMYPEFEDAFATMNKDWNGPYWLENAISHDQANSLSAQSSHDGAAR